MTKIKHVLVVCCLICLCVSGNAQTYNYDSNYGFNNTNSPYTRYGLGQIVNQRNSASMGMGGTAYALRTRNAVNFANPASYSAIDSLTFVFDGSLTLQNTNLSEGGKKINAQNSSLDYVAMLFRVHKRVGVSIGVIPFSHVGYNMTAAAEEDIDDPYSGYLVKYQGDGGIQQAYLGAGVKVFEGLSLGVNASFMYGNISRAIYPYVADASAATYVVFDNLQVRDLKLDFGLQYTQQLGKKHAATLGATYSPEKKLSHNYWQQRGSNKEDISTTFGIPHQLGIGIAYEYDKRLTVSADYTLQKWSDVEYQGAPGYYCDRSMYTVGAEYLPDPFKRKYFSRVKYRLGGYYSDPYYKIEGKRATKEYGIGAGIGLPMLQSKSVVNISAQYVNVSAQFPGHVDEKYLKLTVGLTFNETWFMKRKVR